MKGGGFHWDLLLMAVCCLLCSYLGLPWMCAAAVQSLAHCGSLSVMKRHAPGERPVVDHVIEQRVTTICVALLIGETFLLEILRILFTTAMTRIIPSTRIPSFIVVVRLRKRINMTSLYRVIAPLYAIGNSLMHCNLKIEYITSHNLFVHRMIELERNPDRFHS